MSIEAFFVHDVEIIHPGYGADGRNDQVKDWGNATSEHLKGWVVQQSRTEVRDGREALVSTWVARLPADVAVDGRCRLKAHGLTFELVGRPNQAPTPRGPHHVHVDLELVEG